MLEMHDSFSQSECRRPELSRSTRKRMHLDEDGYIDPMAVPTVGVSRAPKPRPSNSCPGGCPGAIPHRRVRSNELAPVPRSHYSRNMATTTRRKSSARSSAHARAARKLSISLAAEDAEWAV